MKEKRLKIQKIIQTRFFLDQTLNFLKSSQNQLLVKLSKIAIASTRKKLFKIKFQTKIGL